MCAEIINFYYQSDLSIHRFLWSIYTNNVGRIFHHLQIEVALPTKANRVDHK